MVAFERCLEQLPGPQRLDYHRWVQFYLQFCEKYGHSPVLPTSLRPFLNTLTTKNQPMERPRQAATAVRLLLQAAAPPSNITKPLAAKKVHISNSFVPHSTRLPCCGTAPSANRPGPAYGASWQQRLLGHSDIKTTMIYLQTVPNLTLEEAKSPLDCP